MRQQKSTRSERRILRNIQLRLILWFLIAFLLFELILSFSTFLVVRQRSMSAAYTAIRVEWKQKIPDIQGKLQNALSSRGKVSIETDKEPESVITWVKSNKGQWIAEDFGLVGLNSKMGYSATKIFPKPRPTDVKPIWKVAQIGGTSVLMGASNVIVHGKSLGYIVSAYSLKQINALLSTLVEVELNLGFISLAVILPITYLLSRRSLLPIKDALQRQRNFANDAAHELRTPLTILRGNLELVQDSEDIQELRTVLSDSIVELDYLSRVLGDISTLSRFGSGAVQVQLRELNLSAILAQVVQELKPMADAKQVLLHFIAEEDHIPILGDGALIRQLAIILVENAVKYNHAHGMCRIQVARKGNEIEIQITDDGIGISDHDMPLIFDRFYRAKPAEHHTSGSGIGLAMAAWIVDAHKGRILATSQEGVGSVFRIFLPCMSAHHKTHFEQNGLS